MFRLRGGALVDSPHLAGASGAQYSKDGSVGAGGGWPCSCGWVGGDRVGGAGAGYCWGPERLELGSGGMRHRPEGILIPYLSSCKPRGKPSLVPASPAERKFLSSHLSLQLSDESNGCRTASSTKKTTPSVSPSPFLVSKRCHPRNRK